MVRYRKNPDQLKLFGGSCSDVVLGDHRSDSQIKADKNREEYEKRQEKKRKKAEEKRVAAEKKKAEREKKKVEREDKRKAVAEQKKVDAANKRKAKIEDKRVKIENKKKVNIELKILKQVAKEAERKVFNNHERELLEAKGRFSLSDLLLQKFEVFKGYELGDTVERKIELLYECASTLKLEKYVVDGIEKYVENCREKSVAYACLFLQEICAFNPSDELAMRVVDMYRTVFPEWLPRACYDVEKDVDYSRKSES